MKNTAVPSRFVHVSNAFEFSGWGTMSHMDLAPDDVQLGEQDVKRAAPSGDLGQLVASAVAGNAILGGVFYTLPAVFLAAGVL